MDRREFVVRATGVGAALSVFPPGLSGMERDKRPGGLEQRALGKTGEKLSVIGFGGIVVMNATTEQAAERVRAAIDAGVTYFDVAPSYGNAEDMLGPALEPHRKGVFLACKTQGRTKGAANAELESSLRKMRTDHFDLYQHHAVTKKKDVETILGPRGAMEAFEAARKAGKVRFLGFSAHSVEAATALMDGFAFDTILFPVNYATWHAGGFGPQVLARAKEKGMGILCLKAMARGPWPEGATKRYAKCWYEPLDTEEAAAMGLRFTLSHPVTAAIPPGDETLFAMALRIGAGFQPLAPAEVEAIKKKGLAAAPLFRYPSEDA
ncbi:MAG TPA: aldo/keto reductase [Vicinamibacteria bacterium]|nr:aldo/keto reductase [Vicinamibacteria bacterium]